MYREGIEQLRKWKDSRRRKPLMITGVRQCGKTYLIKQFKEGKRSAELEDALQWLRDAGLIHILELATNIEIPLSSYADATYFKVYKSYVQFCKKYQPQYGFKCSLKNIAENDCEGTRTLSLPLYMLFDIRRYFI